ncbi:MAG: NADP-dependent malic enzyme [Erysipelotrichaceae bacterium]|nr:NADP-dependent malic enzyme [Erysipelotrichaceae bacterium]
MNYREESLKKHALWKGKIESAYKFKITNKEELGVAYTPGVAAPCLAIKENPELSFELTARWNTVPVITDGTAILGLGDIGPKAGMPVMEGKCALFKQFGNVDAYPICLDTKDPDEIIRTIEIMAGSFGGINLEDISAPRCFEIEQKLKEKLDIPVFHDDQHGTAIVVGAALLNACRLLKKEISSLKAVVNGAGAAGIAISKYIMKLGIKDIKVLDRNGIICDTDEFNAPQRELAKVINPNNVHGNLKEALVGANLFIGVSVANLVSKDMVRTMSENPILFPLANPVPEISYQDAKEAGAFIVGTGSSENPNQINNVLVFPGLFRGALDARANTVNEEMMLAASKGICECVKDEELSQEYILPYAWDQRAHDSVAAHVKEAAIASGVSKLYKK